MLFLPASRRARLLLVGGLFVAACAVRLFYIESIEFAPMRQYRSAILARAYYYETRTDLPAWELEVSRAQVEQLGWLEPPVLEALVSRFYVAVGGAYLWIPRFLSATWWLLGGGFLLALARRLYSLEVAVLSTAFYLFVPFGVVAGRAFIPHPAYVALLIASFYGMWVYHERPSPVRLIVSSIPAALAGFIYGPSLLFALSGFVALSVSRLGARKAPFSFPLLAFALLSVLPGALYYGQGVIKGSGSVRGQLLSSMTPELLVTPGYWAGWLAQIHIALGLPVLIGAMLGLLLCRGRARTFLLGLWAGYIAYGFVFSYHISTHDYYQLVFIPIAALSLGPVLGFILASFRSYVPTQRLRLALVTLCLAFAAAADGMTIIKYNFDRHGRWQRNEQAIAKEIGEAVQHSTRLVVLSISEGRPLFYHGKVSGAAVQVRNEVLERYLAAKQAYDSPADVGDPIFVGFEPEYFVVTELLEFKRKPDLKSYLDDQFPLLVDSTDYLIYDMRNGRRDQRTTSATLND